MPSSSIDEKIPFFQKLTAEELHAACSQLQRRDFEPGEILLPAGSCGPEFFLLRSGWVEISVEKLEGGERTSHVLNVVGAGFLGEVNGADLKGNSASVVALTQISCWVLTWDLLYKLISRAPQLFRNYGCINAEFTRQKNVTDTLRGAHNVDVAVASTLLLLADRAAKVGANCAPGFPFPMSAVLIARFTGHHADSVRGTLTKLCKWGAIDRPETHRWIITNREILLSLANGSVLEKKLQKTR